MEVSKEKVNVFAGKFFGDMGTADRASVTVIDESPGLYKMLAAVPVEPNRTGTMNLRRRQRRSALRRLLIRAAAFACALLAASPSYSESASNNDDGVVLELSALGKRGETILRARKQVLDVLQQGNGCADWFREADPAPGEVLRSLHYELEIEGPSYIYGVKDVSRGQLFKHPWAARSIQNGGQNSTIVLNANGPFFNRTSFVMQLDPRGIPARPDGLRLLTTSSYEGNTPEAQITILLHELGHIIGRLPEDDDSWDGQSSRNTSEVHRHCKNETRAAARNSPKGSI
jgi:hypothetical protein